MRKSNQALSAKLNAVRKELAHTKELLVQSELARDDLQVPLMRQTFGQFQWRWSRQGCDGVYSGDVFARNPHHVHAAKSIGSLSVVTTEPLEVGGIYTQTIWVQGEGSVNIGLVTYDQVEHAMHRPHAEAYIPSTANPRSPTYVGKERSAWSSLDKGQFQMVGLTPVDTGTTMSLTVDMHSVVRKARLIFYNGDDQGTKVWENLQDRMYIVVVAKRQADREVVLMPYSLVVPQE